MTGASPSAATERAERMAEEMAAAWRRGERPRAEDYLARGPITDEDAVRLIYEEWCLREERGEPAVTAEILQRFPAYADRLALLVECGRLMNPPPPPLFLEVGADLGDFHLEAELGRGSAGRTYLALQKSLAGRLLALKATPLPHDEHLSLARLQHPHVVPLYFEHEFPDLRIRVIGMPFLGGAGLDSVLDELAGAAPARERTGRQLLDALDRRSRNPPGREVQPGPFRAFTAQATYVQVVAWIGACLADALQCAHEQNLVHFDVKASNVLLASDGRPMLLDFHLAQAPVGPDRPVPDRLGGTIGKLSPEQRAAMESLARGEPIAATVDGRSDIYSLGLLLYEALSGTEAAGAPDQPPAPIRSLNPRVSPGLADIVHKCLALKPDDRYPDALALARDLRRHLSDQPLRGVANRSILEQWRKWRRRSPGGLTRSVVRIGTAPLVLAVLAAGFLMIRERDREIDAAVHEAGERLDRDRPDEAALILDRAAKSTAWFPASSDRARRLRDRLARVENERLASTLHDLVEALRFRFSGGTIDDDEVEAFLRRGRALWVLRNRFAAGEAMKPDRQDQLRVDMLDLATIWAGLAARAKNGKSSAGLREAVALLRDARRYGAGPALARDLARYQRALGEVDPEPVVQAPPRTAWEHYDLGASYWNSGDAAAAEASFRRSVELDPSRFWPQFFWGIASYRLGRPRDAATALSACVALSPRSAECYFNRGKAHEALGETNRAIADYTRALELRSTLGDAALNRGLLFKKTGKATAARADLERAASQAQSRESGGLANYHLALIHLEHGERSKAIPLLKRAVAAGCPDAQAALRRLEQSNAD